MNNTKKLARRIGLAFTLVLGLSAVGCVGAMEPLGGGDDDDVPQTPDAGTPVTPPPADAGGEPEPTPQAFFDGEVVPKIAGCVACHQGGPVGFLGTGGATGYYASIKASDVIDLADAAKSVLLTHRHTASTYPELDNAAKDAIEEWLALEIAAQ